MPFQLGKIHHLQTNMATFTPGEVFVDGQQVNGDRLNNHVASAIPLPAFISERAETSTLDLIDNLLVWKGGTNTLEKIEVTNLFNIPNAEVTVGTLTVKDKMIHIGDYDDIATNSYATIAFNIPENRLDINGGYSPGSPLGFHNPIDKVFIGAGTSITLSSMLNCASTIGNIEYPQTIYMRGFNLAPAAGNPLHALSPEVGDVFYEVSTNSIKVYTNDGYVDIVTTGSGLGSTRSYTKNLSFSAVAWNALDVTRFTNAYIYKTPGEITVPAGETWYYTMTLSVDTGGKSVGDNEVWGDIIAYLDTTEIARFKFRTEGINGLGNTGTIPQSLYARVSLINADTTGGKELKFVWYGYNNDGEIGGTGLVKGDICLDIELDADSEFKDINL